MPNIIKSRRIAGALSLGLTGVTLLSASAATMLTLTHPAAAAAILSAAANAVTCGTTNPCVSGKNTDAGPGVYGSSVRGTGVSGKAMQPYSSGVVGENTTTQEGGIGVSGTAKGIGIGVLAQAPAGDGVVAVTNSGTGLLALSSTGTGIFTDTSTGTGIFTETSVGVGLFSEAAQGTAIQAYSGKGPGIAVDSTGAGTNAAVLAHNFTGPGGDFFGTTNGLIARAPAAGGFPLVVTDDRARKLFYVNGTGDVYYRGTLHHFTAAAGNAAMTAYSPSSTGPTIEDTGSAQLIGGVAAVRLDAAFAATIDPRTAYRVFVTPDGDTPHGLFVAAKTANGFVVREAQNGRSTVSFDYRIVATALGQAGERMGLANPAAEPQAALAARPVMPAAPRRP